MLWLRSYRGPAIWARASISCKCTVIGKEYGNSNLSIDLHCSLTPKLLSGLKFTKAVTLQIVHNGASLDRHAHVSTVGWSRKGYCI